MALISRITKLENSLPEPKEPMPDLSELSIDELCILDYWIRQMEAGESISLDDEKQCEIICQKISWKAG